MRLLVDGRLEPSFYGSDGDFASLVEEELSALATLRRLRFAFEVGSEAASLVSSMHRRSLRPFPDLNVALQSISGSLLIASEIRKPPE